MFSVMRAFTVVLCSSVLVASVLTYPAQTPSPLGQLVLPAGFRADVFAENVTNARSMALGPQGTVFVGSRTGDKVHAVVDRNGDYKADRVVVIASGLDQPNGVAMRNGALYVATASRILRFDDIEKHLDAPPAPVVVLQDLPTPRAGHSWKFIAFGPDDMLYMSVGAPCNICVPPAMASSIVRMRPDGSDMEMFAEGIRNSVGFDWHPVTRELWFTDNGRDGLGDDVPNDELNVAWKPGLHFGFPFCHQGDVSDPQFGSQRACSTTEPPVLKVGPHVAAVGMMFYTGSMFPAVYKNAAIIAQHGSWDRSTPSGYRVMAARTDGRTTSTFEPLVDGFLPKGRAPSGRGAGAAAVGRPVDVLQMPDGSILISDDSGNRLIRISYGASATANTAGPAPVPQSTQQTLEVADYAELPVTGDNKSTNLISGQLARGSILRDEPGGQRFFVNDLNGPLYILNKQTKQLTTYLNFDGAGDHAGLFPKFTAAQGFAAGLMNFVFDPDYARNGVFYTLHMENPNTPGESPMPKPGVVPGLNLAGYTTTPAMPTPILPNATSLREMVIVEWTDRQIGNTTFEGTAREVFRMQLPGLFHPLNEIIFNPAARPGDPDWRVMYLGIGDSGTGERPGPMRLHAQRLDTLHGKILRIIPMLSEHASTSTVSANGRYRIPNDNPFVSVEGARKEIWALGLRNPHRMTWYVDPAPALSAAEGRPREAVLLAFNIGLVSWETVVIIKKGANYGYPLREGTQSMSATNGMGPLPADDTIPVQLSDTVTRGTVKPSYAVAAYPHTATAGGDAIANGFVYRGKRIPALRGTLVFGDITTGRIWYTQMSEVLAADDGNPLTLAPLHELSTRLRALSEETFRRRGGQGDTLPGFGAVAGRGRVDIRLAEDNDGELYVLTKGDGMVRELRSVR